MSINFDGIYGNNELKSIIADAIENNRMLHSFILEGVEGTGKLTFAKEVTKALACTSFDKPCNRCESCRKINEDILTDVFIYGVPDDKAAIPVEVIRQIKNDAVTVPGEIDFKMFIITDGDKMNVNAQNALLKILEEPPANMYFIILCSNSSLLLPTIISRAPLFRMEKFSYDVLKDYFLKTKEGQNLYNNDENAFEHVLKSSGGSLGLCMKRMNKRGADKENQTFEFISKIISAINNNDKEELLLIFAEISTKKREVFTDILTDIRLALRDILISKKSEDYECLFFPSVENAAKSGENITFDAVKDMIDITNNFINLNELNSNINLLKSQYISRLLDCM